MKVVLSVYEDNRTVKKAVFNYDDEGDIINDDEMTDFLLAAFHELEEV